ncbi:MAG TPA: hypothetical protein VE244_10140 [Nitrososphaeraceae archaeon]|nr:hypothetical protein [Nitrososphaeraceae archaeon]
MMLLTERRFYYTYITNSLGEVAKKVIYHNNTGSNESQNAKSIGIKALDERYASRLTLYTKINQG